MDYCIVNEDGIIENIIVAESPDVIPGMTLLESYDGASIGDIYAPPEPEHEPTETELLAQQLTDMQLASIAQGQRQTALELATIEQGQKITDVELEALKNV